MRSLERYLLGWILGVLTLGAVLVALVTYSVTLNEMNEVFDAELKSVAGAVAGHLPSGSVSVGAAAAELPARTDKAQESEIVTLTWTSQGQRLYASDPRVALPFLKTEGLSRPIIDGEQWIIYSRVHADGVAQAAERKSSRQEMAGESAAKVLLPLAGLVAVVGGLLVFGLRRGLHPLDRAARDIAARSAISLAPISFNDVPSEIVPLVASTNGLLLRLASAFSAQSRFLADAAHELRTPVTALRLQLQLLKRSADETERRQAIAALEAGIDRSQRLIEQLLQVARSEPDGETPRGDVVDLGELARTVVASMSAQADQRHLDLGAKAARGVEVRGDARQLTVLLNNLVENALRYTPAGGVIDVEVRVNAGMPILSVTDNGPGIPEAERSRAFDRFYRCEDAQARSADGTGSGLGLAIVRAITERHGAQVSLKTPASGQGLEVCVAFTATASAAR